MGKLLDIRVTARTYDEDAVAKAWPRLVALAWPEWSARLGMDGIRDYVPGYAAGQSPVEKALGGRGHGVVELAEALPDALKFGGIPDGVAAVLQAPVAEAEKIKRELDAALGDWNAQKASALTFQLEDALSRAEQSLDQVK